MPASPAIDLATHVGTNVGAATLGTNCFHGPIRAPEEGVPEKAIFFIEGGGPAAEPDNGAATRVVYATVQVWGRSDDDDYGGGKTWVDSIYDAIEHAAITGYINVRNLRAAPSYMGMDDGRRHEWSWDAELIHEE